MTIRRDAAYVANVIDKTPNWVRRNARRYPHHKAGQTYFWTDDDITEMLSMMRVRPAQTDAPQQLAPLGPSRKRAS